jgi:nicotinamidase-related amidase
MGNPAQDGGVPPRYTKVERYQEAEAPNGHRGPTVEPGIIFIDMLKGFVWGSLKCDRAQRIVDPLRRLLDAARGAGIPVIFANDARVHQVGPESATRGPQATKTDSLADQLAARVIDELQPRVGDYHVLKHHYGAFHGTNLHSLLEDLGVDTVVLCGLHTSMCVASTAAEAFHHGYHIIVPTDGVEDRTEKEHNAGLDHLTRSYGAELASVNELIERMANMALFSGRTVARSPMKAFEGSSHRDPAHGGEDARPATRPREILPGSPARGCRGE